MVYKPITFPLGLYFARIQVWDPDIAIPIPTISELPHHLGKMPNRTCSSASYVVVIGFLSIPTTKKYVKYISFSKWKESEGRQKMISLKVFMTNALTPLAYIGIHDNALFDNKLKTMSITAWKVTKCGVISGPSFPRFGSEVIPYLDIFHAVSKKL